MRLRTRGAGSRGAGTRSPGRSGRRTAALAALMALALAAPVSATATNAAAGSAAKPAASADDIRQYEIHVHHSTSRMRTAIAASGVSVDEADEETVVVSGRADQIKKLRAQGYEVAPLGAAPNRVAEGETRLYDFPSADSRYHVGDEHQGSIPLDNVIGKARFIVLPPGRWGLIDSPEILPS